MLLHRFAPKTSRSLDTLPDAAAAPSVGPAGVAAPSGSRAPEDRTLPRIAGYDLARAVAVLAMIPVNFRYLMEAEENGPQMLVKLTGWLDGRPAAAFAVLAGISLALMQRRRNRGGRAQGPRSLRATVLKRAAFLYLFGLAFLQIWPPDILHFYGVYFALGAFMLSIADRTLWGLAATALAVATVLLIGFEFVPGDGWVDVDEPAFWTPLGLLRNAFIDGYYPVFPWFGFILAGVWLGRRDLTGSARRRIVALASAAVFGLAEAAAVLIEHLADMHTFVTDIPMIDYFFEAYPFPPTAVYFFSAGSSAVLMILACISLADNRRLQRWIPPLLAVGRMALSVYVLHIAAGFLLLIATGRLDAENSLTFACVSAASCCVLMVLGSRVWLAYFRQGPLEGLMRRISQ